jgi:general secretion pathway protein F
VAKFSYRAYTTQGTVTVGTLAADGLDSAIDAVYGLGLTPFETTQVYDQARADHAQGESRGDAARPSIWKRELVESNRFGLKELASFTVELSTLVNAGLRLDAAFRIIGGPGASPKTIRLANALLKDVVGGLQLSEAMARRPAIFPSDYRAIVAAGEAGGATGEVLAQIAELLKRRLEIRGKITTALIYPLVLVLMSLVSMFVIAFVLLPSIGPIFADAGMPLPGVLNTFAALMDNWPSAALVTLVGALGIGLIWRKLRQNAEFVSLLDRMACALPLIGWLLERREAGKFARALGTLLVARVPLMSAMQTARALVTNRYLNALYGNVINRVPEGTPLHRAFENTRLLPMASLRMIAVGEESGRLAPMLIEVAAAIETDLQRQIERAVSMLTPVLTMVVGGSIAGLIMQVMSAVLSINDLAFK